MSSPGLPGGREPHSSHFRADCPQLEVSLGMAERHPMYPVRAGGGLSLIELQRGALGLESWASVLCVCAPAVKCGLQGLRGAP